jgi:hypothetical protein
MYSEDTEVQPIHSAHKEWDNATPGRRIKMLEEAGITSYGSAYKKFDDLPMSVKLDLNYTATMRFTRKHQEQRAGQ